MSDSLNHLDTVPPGWIQGTEEAQYSISSSTRLCSTSCCPLMQSQQTTSAGGMTLSRSWRPGGYRVNRKGESTVLWRAPVLFITVPQSYNLWPAIEVIHYYRTQVECSTARLWVCLHAWHLPQCGHLSQSQFWVEDKLQDSTQSTPWAPLCSMQEALMPLMIQGLFLGKQVTVQAETTLSTQKLMYVANVPTKTSMCGLILCNFISGI